MGVRHIRADQISTEDGLVISGNVNLINGTFFTDGARFTGDWVKDENENVSREGKVGVSKDTVDNSENSANLQVSGDIDFTGDLYNNGVLFTAILGSSPWANLVSESNIYFTAGDVSIGSTTGNAKLHVEGNVYASSNLEVGSANLFVDTETSRIGVNTSSPAATLHVEGNVYASSNLEVGSANLFVDTETSRIGVNTRSPAANLHVEGNVYASSNLEVGGQIIMGDHMIPSLNEEYDIGSATRKIRHLYLSDNSLYVGGAQIGADVNGTITVTNGIAGIRAEDVPDLDASKITGGTLDAARVPSLGASDNTGGEIVRRDGSGNFSAGTITATLSGNSTTTSDGVSTNTANKIVRRNASGDISIRNLSAHYAEFDASSPTSITLGVHSVIRAVEGVTRDRTGSSYYSGSDLHTCAKFNQSVVFKSLVFVESDRRIKEEITTMDQKHSLDVIEKLRPVSYKLMKNGALALGYIGQEISDIISPAVNCKSIEPIGNIRIHGVVTKNKSITDNEGRECVSLVIELEKSLQEEIKNKKDILFGVGIQLMDGRTRNLYYDPKLCDDPTDMSIELLDYTKDKQLDKDTRILVFGEIVTDFCIIDYNKVFVVVSSAVKELNDIRKEDRSRIETLENQVSQLLARVEALESK